MILNNTQYGVKKTGVQPTVASNSVARLMYYLDTLCNLIPLDDDGKLAKLRNHSRYWLLGEIETLLLLNICLKLDP